MNRADFDQLVQETIARTAGLLIAKGAEYAGDGDRLLNFKRNADKNGLTVLECWQIYWGKHVDSINTYMLRVKDQATRLALQEVVTEADNAVDASERFAAVDPAKFRKRVNSAVRDAMRNIELTLSEPIEGRFDDNINYSFLCQAILKELRDAEHED